MSSDRESAGRRSRRTAGACVASLGVVVSVVLSACGTTDEASRMTLPPLETTTTTTTTTTTIPSERFYTIQPGDILTVIAATRGVTVQAILEVNPELENEDSIQAGVTIEIPANTVAPAVAEAEPPQSGDATTPADTEP